MLIPSNPNCSFAFRTNCCGRILTKDRPTLSQITYSFKSKRRYIIEVEEYQQKLFVLKFYLKNHKDSEIKFNIILNDEKPFRILTTCINVLHHIKSEFEPQASFGFVGAPKLSEENDFNTTRFRVYSKIGFKHFSPHKYIHVSNIANSTFLILDRTIHDERSVEVIQGMFDQLYHGL